MLRFLCFFNFFILIKPIIKIISSIMLLIRFTLLIIRFFNLFFAIFIFSGLLLIRRSFTLKGRWHTSLNCYLRWVISFWWLS